MCVNKVAVADLLHYRLNNYFNCGRCPACVQQNANRRASKIRNNYLPGFICYFVHLTYKPDFVPYIFRSDLEDYLNSYDKKNHVYKHNGIPIWRDVKHIRVKDNEYNIKKRHPIGNYMPDEYIQASKIDEFPGICISHETGKKPKFDAGRISVVFTPDFQNFINRFRQNLFRDFGYRVPLSYYYAPEYGPTTFRFHIHLLLWLPEKTFSEVSVRSYVLKTWPYADKSRTSNFIEVARNPASYCASYVNTSADIPDCLTRMFPPRPSHSLGFGFVNKHFSLSEILRKYNERRDFTYPVLRKHPNGTPYTDYVYCPKHVIYRYFPKIKGFYRCSLPTLLDAYQNPLQYLELSQKDVGETETGIPKYQSRLIDVTGTPITFTLSERDGFLRRLYNCYTEYYSPLGYSWIDMCFTIVYYLYRRSLDLYKQSQSNYYLQDNYYQFFNLQDIVNGRIYSPQVIHDIQDYNLITDCNEFPDEIKTTQELLDKFNSNIKHRKINALN